MTVIIYGIPNCESVKKTLDWCNKNHIEYTFHNYKKIGIDTSTLQRWCSLVGWESIFNKKSATWKQIADNYKLINEKVAIDIMLKNNSIIKRHVIETGKRIMVGYNLESIADFLKK